MDMILLILIFFPLLAALSIVLVRPTNVKVWVLSATLIELIVSLYCAWQFKNNTEVQFSIDLPWVSSLGLHFAVGIDGISLPLILLTTLLVPFIVLSSWANTYHRPISFYALILIMQMALVGVFAARDGLLFYLFWEVALIPVYFICLIWGGENRGWITFKFFVFTLAGSLFMLVALIYLYLHTPGSHSFAMMDLYNAGRSLSSIEQTWIFWGLFVAFAIKMPVFPFHTWQPDTYTVAPTQGTMLLSAIMLKMGIFGLIRWLVPVVPSAVNEWGTVAVMLSVIGIIYASCIALVQKDFKRLIAYSSIAHVGLIAGGVMTVSSNGMQGAMVQMLSHGIIVFALFYLVDLIEKRSGTRTILELGGIRNVAPILTTVFVIVMLGSVALPLTSGFIGEFLLITSIFSFNNWIGVMAGLTIILGAVYMLVAFQKVMSGEVTERTATMSDLTVVEKWTLYPIVLLVLLIGIYPSPLLDISQPSVTQLIQSIQDLTALAK
jgi:NADH-quinone oxidoreductase subunit M